MNKVLKYFGGSVGKFMLFILPALAYVILTVFYDATVIGWVVTACVFVTMLNIGFGGKEIVSVGFAVIGLVMELFGMFSNYLGDTTFEKSHYWEVVEMRAIVKFYIIGLIATIALFTAIFLIIFRAKKGIGKLRFLLILCLVLAVAGEAYCFFQSCVYTVNAADKDGNARHFHHRTGSTAHVLQNLPRMRLSQRTGYRLLRRLRIQTQIRDLPIGNGGDFSVPPTLQNSRDCDTM